MLGHQESDPVVARDLGLPVPRKGEFISVRVYPAAQETGLAATAEIGDAAWRVARPSDPVIQAPSTASAFQVAA